MATDASVSGLDEALASYQPTSLTAATWARFRDDAVSLVARLDHLDEYSARKALSRLVVFLADLADLRPDATLADLLTPDQVAGYLEREKSSGANRQGTLNALLRAVNGKEQPSTGGRSAEPRLMPYDRARLLQVFVLVQLEVGEHALDRIPVDLVEIADGVVEVVAPLAHRHRVEVRLGANTSAPVHGDPQALNRVLRNLLDNAIRHAPEGSVIDVMVDTADGWGTVRVQDRGPGFPPEFGAHAFDVFSRADPSRARHGGAGLGLAIAQQFVQAHGGTAWIEPDPPRRSPSDSPRRVEVELPPTRTGPLPGGWWLLDGPGCRGGRPREPASRQSAEEGQRSPHDQVGGLGVVSRQ